MKNAITFGQQADVYAKGRPGYPAELYDWIATHSPGNQLLWDVGTGSGQAAAAMTQHFHQIHATDISEEQISAAVPHPQISYHVAPAQWSGLPDNAVDAVTVATAVHWFADAAFWNEVSRVSKSGALFSAWTYALPQSSQELTADYLNVVYDLIDPYWAEGNRICMAGYTAENLSCPFHVLPVPVLKLKVSWTADQLVNFARSWSAYFRAGEDGHASRLTEMSETFLSASDGKESPITMKISILAVRIKTKKAAPLGPL